MLTTTSAAQIRNIITTTNQTGAKTPPAITAAWEQHERITAASREVYPAGTALADVTYAALDAGRDPSTDPEVQRVVIAQIIGAEGVGDQVRRAALDDLSATLRANSGALIAALRKPFDAASKDITRYAPRLGGVELQNADAILRKGGDAAEAWSKVSQATQTIDLIISTWTLLAMQTGFTSDDRRHHILKYTDPTFEQWEQLELSSKRPTAYEAQQLGLTLSLADGDEYNARARALNDSWLATEQAERDRANGKLPSLQHLIR